MRGRRRSIGELLRPGLAISFVSCSAGAIEHVETVVANAGPAPDARAPVPSSSKPTATVRHSPRSTLDVTVTPIADLDGTLPFPCDFERPYRGTIDSTSVSLILHATGAGKLQGLSHYDEKTGSIAVAGKTGASAAGSAAFELSETPGGKLTGTCNPATGVLTGQFELGSKRSGFTLQPLPADWPGVYGFSRETKTFPRPSVSVAGAAGTHCEATDTGLRVFGLADASAEKRLNSGLEQDGYQGFVQEIQVCSGDTGRGTVSTLTHAGSGVLVTRTRVSVWGDGALSSMAYFTDPVVYDLASGDPVSLDRIVVDQQRLMELVERCLSVYDHVEAKGDTDFPLDGRIGCDDPKGELYLWGCPQSPRTPIWQVVSEGLVILRPTATFEPRQGVILPWSTLLAADLLHADSPIKRLWQTEKPLESNQPVCSAALEGETIKHWRVKTALPGGN